MFNIACGAFAGWEQAGTGAGVERLPYAFVVIAVPELLGRVLKLESSLYRMTLCREQLGKLRSNRR